MTSVRYDDSLFRGRAGFYADFRPAIPTVVTDLIARESGVDGRGRLLDVGVGTGQVLLGLADRFELSVGIDPDREMLLEARRVLDEAGLGDRVVLEEGRAPDLPRALGPYRLATFSRVFHWLDRPATASAVLDVLEPGGSIAVLGDGSFWTGGEEWQATVRDVVQRELGPGRRAGGKQYVPPGEPFEQSLRTAGFRDVREFRVDEERTWTFEMIRGYLYSTSFAGRELFGEDVELFERDLAEALGSCSPDGVFPERASFGIWIGRKPART